jgi:segregation and condensation protein A
LTAEMQDDLHVHLDAFDGPIELLLELIRARKMEITEVSVAMIVDDYLAAVHESGVLDLESASKFLLVAATLLHIKTQRLLPIADEAEFDEELLADAERDVLLARLMAARTFADVAAVLHDSLEEGALFVPRVVQSEQPMRNVTPDILRQVTVEDLARMAAAALNRQDEPVPVMAHVEPLKVSLRATIEGLSRTLPEMGVMGYRAMCRGKSMLEAVVHFLAVLELIQAGVVRIRQASPRDDIEVTWVGDPGWRPRIDIDIHFDEPPAKHGDTSALGMQLVDEGVM